MSRMDECSGVYEVMFPVGWFGGAPKDQLLGAPYGQALPDDWTETMFSQSLHCGIAVTAERRGFTVYDFAGWSPGVANPPGTPAIRTLATVSSTAKPAVIQRLRVINTHIVLLHSAVLQRAGEVTSVQRVNERDLYRLEYADETGEPVWFQVLGNTLASHVTSIERQRFGAISADAYEQSLQWLDRVVATDAILLFDLMNQAMSALGTLDYALAVVSGWTVCELRLRALARDRGGDASARAYQVTECLQRAGDITSTLRAGLDDLRGQRNDFLHSGVEPSEATAQEAVLLSAIMLHGIIPSFAVRPGKGLLLL